MNHYRVYLALAVAVIGLGLSYSFLFGGSPVVPVAKLVYVDRESGEAFLLQAKSSPASHPVTGKPTLDPGLYCDKCQAWKPVGSMERLQTHRSDRKCPIHKTPLLSEGPLPGEA